MMASTGSRGISNITRKSTAITSRFCDPWRRAAYWWRWHRRTIRQLSSRRSAAEHDAAPFRSLSHRMWLGPEISGDCTHSGGLEFGAGDVVFIDDSPLEIDEVKRAHPGMECILFPKHDPAAVFQLAYRLRDLFGKRDVREEDRIRSKSLRSARQLREDAGAAEDQEAFLRDAGASLTLTWPRPPLEARTLELINKTNQFNINGRRYAEAEWQVYTRKPETAVLVVEYADKYGPLGKIAAVTGTRERDRFRIDTWVMSCRAFSRRIEHHTLKEIFDRWEVAEVAIEFQPTERNGPSSGFFASLLGSEPSGPFVLSRERFLACCPPLYHQRADIEAAAVEQA